MKKILRLAVLTAAATTLTVTAAPAQADDWQLTNTTYTTVHVGLPAAARTLLAAPSTCVPKDRGVAIYGGSENTWFNLSTGQIEYEYRRTASAWATDDCATGARVRVQVSEYAPYGEPPVAQGQPVTATSLTAQGGYYRANATASLRVQHYDPRVAYTRGPALLETKASGWYRDKANRWLFIACVVTYQTVTPTPTGPVMGEPTEPQNCGDMT